VYVPAGHHKALSLESSVVVGMRGAGKSLWTAVLSSDHHRDFVAALAGSPALGQAAVRVGFGLDDTNALFPNASVLAQIVKQGNDPFTIWKTVVLRHALHVQGAKKELTRLDWRKLAAWVGQNPEAADDLLTECDGKFTSEKRALLVLFDALDRLAPTWPDVRHFLAGALRFALACRSRRALRLKFFLRPDMEEDAEIWKFQDSSKLRHSKVELSWRTTDLYALIFTFLANDPTSGKTFRSGVSRLTGATWAPRDDIFAVPRQLVSDDDKLRDIVEAIAGPWMGRSHKRGFTYTWIPTHLADAVGRISPRSFQLTFRRASEVTEEQFRAYERALHYEAIQQGVAYASEIRIAEIKEDYPWMQPLLEASRGLSVPCRPDEMIARWTPDRIAEVQNATRKLPPRRFTTDPNRRGRATALIDDLVELAVLYRTEDGRLNMPDIFRVGFGIKRKGGVKPPK
jgi:hypothetical protein